MADSSGILVDRLLAGDTRAVARSISIVEQEPAAAGDLLRHLYPHTGQALVLGLTGSPGSGKSSLVDGLVSVFREQGSKVGVVAVDPSSAFSGGAILGDRVRMQDHATDPGVFIRSMATRGHLGGLSRATSDAIDILDAAGYDPVLVETVGVGQDEIEIVRTADAVAVVLVPGMGDDIQAIKAGILEIADLFVINKADRDGADRLQSDLDYVMSLAPETHDRRPQIFRTVAVRRQGLAELEMGIRSFIDSVGERRRRERRRERAEARFLSVMGERLLSRVHSELLAGTSYEELVSAIAERSIDPYTAAERVMERLEVR
jgi:LAO/AO transport system kinase